MGDRGTRTVNCYQCGLPVSRYQLHNVGDRREPFCCSGCYLVLRITGERGEEGLSQALFGRFGIGLLLSMNVMLIGSVFYGGIYSSISVPPDLASPLRFVLFFLSLPVIVILGYPILRASVEDLKARRITTEMLVLFGSFSAFLISAYSTFKGEGHVYYETATMVLTLFTLGRYIEARAKVRASNSVRGMMNSVPLKATVLEGGRVREVGVDDIRGGEEVLVREGERVPVDGIVIEGKAEVDESIIKGESMPCLKKVGDEVFAGTLNLSGNILVRTTKARKDFLVSRIQRLIDELQKRPSSMVRIADRIAAIFVPLVVALSTGAFLYWVYRGDPSTGVMRMLTVALISCPCAFGISAPLALWRGLGEAMKKGAVIKGGHILEGLSEARTVFFDKTGTLTSGEFLLKDIRPERGVDREEALRIAASLESYSPHPLGKAILKEAQVRGLALHKARDVVYHTGLGIEGEVNGRRYCIGGGRWLAERGIRVEDGDERPSIYLWEDRGLLAAFTFEQGIRESAPWTIRTLKAMGVKTVVITGDGKGGVREIATSLGADELFWGLLPQEKVEVIRRERGVTVMVGDGINDAPSLEAASIGIAMGCGVDLARETADITFSRDNLALVPYLIGLSRRVRRKIYTNFLWAFFYNGIGIYLALKGMITPLFAVVAMLLSSLTVIANSSRI